jgi:hypothetical protein
VGDWRCNSSGLPGAWRRKRAFEFPIRGAQYLAAFLLSLNLIAFLFHTVMEWCDDKYVLLRQTLGKRQTFWLSGIFRSKYSKLNQRVIYF